MLDFSVGLCLYLAVMDPGGSGGAELPSKEPDARRDNDGGRFYVLS